MFKQSVRFHKDATEGHELRSEHLQAPYLDSILGIIKTAGSKLVLIYISSLVRSLKFKSYVSFSR